MRVLLKDLKWYDVAMDRLHKAVLGVVDTEGKGYVVPVEDIIDVEGDIRAEYVVIDATRYRRECRDYFNKTATSRAVEVITPSDVDWEEVQILTVAEYTKYEEDAKKWVSDKKLYGVCDACTTCPKHVLKQSKVEKVETTSLDGTTTHTGYKKHSVIDCYHLVCIHDLRFWDVAKLSEEFAVKNPRGIKYLFTDAPEIKEVTLEFKEKVASVLDVAVDDVHIWFETRNEMIAEGCVYNITPEIEDIMLDLPGNFFKKRRVVALGEISGCGRRNKLYDLKYEVDKYLNTLEALKVHKLDRLRLDGKVPKS